jgi:hypothetical protein
VKSLASAELLEVWERAAAASTVERPLILLAATAPDRPHEHWEQLTAAERDCLLLDLRAMLFGRSFRSLIRCVGCGDSVELLFDAQDVRPKIGMAGRSELSFTHQGFSGTFRLPRTVDWLALTDTPGDVEQAPARAAGGTARLSPEHLRHALARRCLLAVTDVNHREPDSIPPEVIGAVADAIAQNDADCHTEIAVACPACGHDWAALFDIASYLWSEIDAHCRRLLHQVHRLAQTYGWTEEEILRLTPVRRERYLSLIDHG